MNERIAKAISTITSPFLVVIVFGLWAIGSSVQTVHDFALLGGLCLILIVGLPFFYILVNIQRGKITDMHVAIREQRAMPFVVATFGAIVLLTLYILLGAPKHLVALAASLIVSGVIFGAVTQFWKISIHAAAYTGAVIIVSFVISFDLLWLLLLLPVIIWARLVRKRHSPAQAILASLLNAVCVTGTLLFFR